MMIEVVSFKLLPNTDEQKFIEHANIVIRDFISKQKGYIRVDLAKDPNANSWIAMHYWDNIENNTLAIENTRSSEIWKKYTTDVDMSSMQRQQLNVVAGPKAPPIE